MLARGGRGQLIYLPGIPKKYIRIIVISLPAAQQGSALITVTRQSDPQSRFLPSPPAGGKEQ